MVLDPPNSTDRTQEVYEIAGIKLPHGSHLSDVMVNAYRSGAYEYDELEILKRVLHKSDIVMEIGAGAGFLSVYCARLLGSSRVFAYEANPALEEPIRAAYVLNSVSPELNICMLGKDAGHSSFFVSKDFWASSDLRFDGGQEISVDRKSFDSEIARTKANFLIVDIEGGEYELIVNSKLSGIRSLVVEFHPNMLGFGKTTQLIKHLESLGFILDHRATADVCVCNLRVALERLVQVAASLPAGIGSLVSSMFESQPKPDYMIKRTYCFTRRWRIMEITLKELFRQPCSE